MVRRFGSAVLSLLYSVSGCAAVSRSLSPAAMLIRSPTPMTVTPSRNSSSE